MINEILLSSANDIQCIDFSKSEEYVLDSLYKFSEDDIKNNLKWLIKHSVRYNYINLLQNLLELVEDSRILKNLNLEYFIEDLEMLKLLEQEYNVDISYLNYIIFEKFIKNNDIESVGYIINKYDIPKDIVKTFNIDWRKINKKTKKMLESYNFIH